jgi:hypothetical protein
LWLEQFHASGEQHASSSLRRPASEQAVPDSERAEAGFILLAGLGGLLPATLEVGLDLGLVPQVIAQGRVHIRQRERRVLIGDGFQRGSLAVGGNEGVECDTCPADAPTPSASSVRGTGSAATTSAMTSPP